MVTYIHMYINKNSCERAARHLLLKCVQSSFAHTHILNMWLFLMYILISSFLKCALCVCVVVCVVLYTIYKYILVYMYKYIVYLHCTQRALCLSASANIHLHAAATQIYKTLFYACAHPLVYRRINTKHSIAA